MCTFSLCIKLNKILCNILNLGLCACFEVLPCLGTQLMNLRRFGILRLITRNLMKGMNRHKDNIIILIGKFHHLMHPALVILHSDKTSEHAHTIINVNYIVTYRK